MKNIQKKLKFNMIMFILLSMSLLISCNKEKSQAGSGSVVISFNHIVAAEALCKDSLCYVNSAGNVYEINEIQYFVSNVSLWKDGQAYPVSVDSNYHYVDIDIPATLQWLPGQKFPEGTCDSISFIFGLDEQKNVSGFFVNPPERDMFWPDMMGGGYHYMKINGKWLAPPDGPTMPFNLHLGIGMEDDSSGTQQFYPNFFKVVLPLNDCRIEQDNPLKLRLTMDINSWFETPYLWNWNITGGQIMQSQYYMHLAAENGKDAFSVARIIE